jgi:hypothetical protein
MLVRDFQINRRRGLCPARQMRIFFPLNDHQPACTANTRRTRVWGGCASGTARPIDDAGTARAAGAACGGLAAEERAAIAPG